MSGTLTGKAPALPAAPPPQNVLLQVRGLHTDFRTMDGIAHDAQRPAPFEREVKAVGGVDDAELPKL